MNRDEIMLAADKAGLTPVMEMFEEELLRFAELIAPKHEWVGLTDKEIREAYMSVGGEGWCLGGISNAETFYDAIGAKLKEKQNDCERTG